MAPRAFGVLELLEHEDAGALAHDEAVAVAVERPRRALSGSSLRVLRAPRMAANPDDADGADRRLAAAGEHDLGVAAADDLDGVADAR